MQQIDYDIRLVSFSSRWISVGRIHIYLLNLLHGYISTS